MGSSSTESVGGSPMNVLKYVCDQYLNGVGSQIVNQQCYIIWSPPIVYEMPHCKWEGLQ
jgi:hypothetical protein